MTDPPATVVSTHRLTKTFGPRPRGRRGGPDRPPRRGVRLPRARTVPARPPRCGCCSGWSGRPRAGRGARARAGRPGRGCARIGALVEGPGFYPYLSGRDNLRVLARYRRPAATGTVDRVLDRVDLTARGGDRFAAYSLGMKQRLGVAAALLGDPRPAGPRRADQRAGPGRHGGHAPAAASTSPPAGSTVLLSSHLLAEVQEICDRVGIIDGGRLLVREHRRRAARRPAASCCGPGRWTARSAVAMRLAGDDAVEVVDGAGGRPGRRPRAAARGGPGAGPRAGPRAGRRGCRHHRAAPRRALPGGGLLRPHPHRFRPTGRRSRHDRHDHRASRHPTAPAPGPGALVRSTRAELRRLLRWPATWVLVGVWSALSLTFTYVFDWISYRTGETTGPGAAGVRWTACCRRRSRTCWCRACRCSAGRS